jgi:hypothetical protein
MTDEIIDELRAIRIAHSNRFGGDVHAIFEELRRKQARLAAEGWKIAQAPETYPMPAEHSVRRIRFARHEDGKR